MLQKFPNFMWISNWATNPKIDGVKMMMLNTKMKLKKLRTWTLFKFATRKENFLLFDQKNHGFFFCLM